MTAVSAFLSWGSSRDPARTVGDMLRSQEAYGPHGSGAFAFGDVALGRALFRLVPEDDHDEQPLVSACGRLALVADIRLDNRDEVLAALGLQPGAEGSIPDARILLMALERWGEESLLRLLGDYAFILWDTRSGELVLARDPLGQRPLYYHVAERFAAVASMPKGLHAISEVPRGADPDWLMDFIGYVPHRGPRSHYRSISRVEAGHVVRIRDGRAESRRFWNPHRQELGGDFVSLRDRYRAALDRSVRSRLRGRGGAIGAHLSGGWDSSAVAGTAARLLAPEHERLVGFTSVPRIGSVAPAVGSTFADERALAAEAAAMHPNLDHVLVPGTATSPIASLDRVLDLYDRPLATLCNNVWMSKIRSVAADRGVHLILTGEVGNWTISAGQYSILSDYLRQGQWRDWLSEAAALARGRRIRYRGIAAASIGPWLPRRLQEALTVFSSGINTAAYTAAHPDVAAEISAKRRRLFDDLPASHFGRNAEALMNRDFGDYRKAALAGWGTDERDPTADRRLAEFCLSLPLDALLRHGERRALAKEALADRVPRAILDERLKGYQGADWHEGLTADRQGILDLIEEISSSALAASLLHLEGMRQWVRDWPEGGWEAAPVTARYRTALLVGLSAGHFALRAGR